MISSEKKRGRKCTRDLVRKKEGNEDGSVHVISSEKKRGRKCTRDLVRKKEGKEVYT